MSADNGFEIPRLLAIAHKIWFETSYKPQVLFSLGRFEEEAAIYYVEMHSIWEEFEPQQMAHIIFATGCKWIVFDTDGVIPGAAII